MDEISDANKKGTQDIGSTIKGMGLILITMCQKEAEKPNAPEAVKKRWAVISSWLGCSFDAFTKEQSKKIDTAWNAYVALGVSPSKRLAPFFALEKDPSKLRELPPKEVVLAFHGLLGAGDKPKLIWRSSRELRLWVFGVLVWVLAVPTYLLLTRHYGYSMNDDDMVQMLALMFVPPFFTGSARYVYLKYIR